MKKVLLFALLLAAACSPPPAAATPEPPVTVLCFAGDKILINAPVDDTDGPGYEFKDGALVFRAKGTATNRAIIGLPCYVGPYQPPAETKAEPAKEPPKEEPKAEAPKTKKKGKS